MANIRDEAKAYTPKQTKNIAELPSVSVELDMKDGAGIDKNGDGFTYKFVEVNGEEFRIPGVVISQLKDILESKKDLKSFRVKKAGAGLQTRYTVIPLD